MRGKHQRVVAFLGLPTGDLTCNPGMYPDWGLNQQPFGLQARTQSTKPHQTGLIVLLICTSLMANEIEHPFIYQLVICMSS